MSTSIAPQTGRTRRRTSRLQWRELLQTLGPILLVSLAAIWLMMHFVRPAPPHSLTIAGGPPGSTFQNVAERYRKILARSGVELKVMATEGSVDNLNRLIEPHGADIALVQSGLTPPGDGAELVSLGSVFYEPLDIFYRAGKAMQRLSELKGQRIAIGPEGSGVRSLALALLKANGIEPGGSTELLPLAGEAARSALLKHEVEAIFLTGDSASTATLVEMLHADGVRLFDFARADAYVRRFPYLSKLTVPMGTFDLGQDLPPVDTYLVAPTVELVAHSSLHPALCDLLIEAAFEVHAHASVLQSAGQFPNATTHAFRIDPEAARYYKTGDRSFTYRFLPFWVASLVDRALVVLIPIVVVLIPGLRFLPQLYNWRVESRIHKRYGELMALERETLGSLSEARRAALLERLDHIERSVIARGMPGSHAEQLYALRERIQFVRENLARTARAEPAMGAAS